MKDILFVVVFMYSGLLYSQNSTKIRVYIDENSNPIEKNDFDEKLSNYNLYTATFVQHDSLLINRLLLKEELGEISKEQKNLFIYYLKRITGVNIDSTKNIIINFFVDGKNKPRGSCIDHYTADYRYKRYFKKNNHSVQFFFTEKGFVYDKKGVYEDQKNFIRSLFFNYDVGCGNYVIIKANGTFLRVYGEYIQSEIPEKITADWDKLLPRQD